MSNGATLTLLEGDGWASGVFRVVVDGSGEQGEKMWEWVVECGE